MLDDKVVSAVAIGNLKAISEQPAMLSNLAFSNVVNSNNLGQQNAVANQQAVGELGISVLAKGSNTISNLDPLSARSAVDVLTNNELAETIADLKAVLQAFGDTDGRLPAGWWARVRALLALGLEVDAEGRLVVRKGAGGSESLTVVFLGQFRNEHFKLDMQTERVVLNVKLTS